MSDQTPSSPQPSPGGPQLFADLRARNERRAKLASLLDLRQRRHIERVMQVARQHRHRHRVA